MLPVQTFPQWLQEPLNIIGVCREHHDEHERARRRIPWAALPEAVRAWLTELAARDGPVLEYLHRTYPR